MNHEAESLFEQGCQHLQSRQFHLAGACFRAALGISPDFLEARMNLAYALEHQGLLDEAETWYRRSMELDASNLELHLGLGALLVNQKRFGEAEAVYARALRLHPRAAALWSNLGVLKAFTKRDDEAEACLRRALELDGGYAKARFNLSYILLRQGRFEEGWRALQARDPFPYAKPFPFPHWQGEDLRGASLLMGVERGHGDMIFCGRYAAELKARGAARVGILCHPALERLFHRLEGVDQVHSLAGPWPEGGWDFWASPFSLPFHCGTRVDAIPAPVPYLHPDAELVDAWRPRLPETGFRVGLAWKGNPAFENDADRSIPRLDFLAPLGRVAGARFVSLQKGPGEEEGAAPPPGLSVCNLGPLTADFADMAAIVAQLDLVITVDTAIAHLAGAMGKRCWVLLPDYRTDWRWMTGRADTPWYPGVLRLFRQSRKGHWPPLIRKVAANLARAVDQRERS